MSDTPDPASPEPDHGDEPITWAEIDAAPPIEVADVAVEPAPLILSAVTGRDVGTMRTREQWHTFDPRGE